MPSLRFRVIAPAMMPPSGPGSPVPDPMPVYAGGQSNGATFLPAFGNALVSGGGAKVGTKWIGCTYVCPPYLIPGLGEVEEFP